MNGYTNYSTRTGNGEEPWWSYARDLDVGDIGRLPAYVYSKLPLPGSDTAGMIAGDFPQQEYPRRNAQPGRYVPYTNVERQRYTSGVSPQQEDIRPHEQLGPVVDSAFAAMPAVKGVYTAGEALTDIPVQAYRRHVVGQRYPEIGQAFSELGNPVTNTWRAIAGRGEKDVTPNLGWSPMAADTSLSSPDLLSNLRNRVDRWKGSWNVDIPYLTEGEYPQLLITKDQSNQILPRLAEMVTGKQGVAGPGTRGFSAYLKDDNKGYLADLIAARREAIPQGTLTHETGHLAKRRLLGYGDLSNQPTDLINKARESTGIADPSIYGDYLEAITGTNPWYDAKFRTPIKARNELGEEVLKASPYRNLTPLSMGDELWTRYNAGQLARYQPTTPFNDPEPIMSGKISELVDSLIHPSMR